MAQTDAPMRSAPEDAEDAAEAFLAPGPPEGAAEGAGRALAAGGACAWCAASESSAAAALAAGAARGAAGHPKKHNTQCEQRPTTPGVGEGGWGGGELALHAYGRQM